MFPFGLFDGVFLSILGEFYCDSLGQIDAKVVGQFKKVHRHIRQFVRNLILALQINRLFDEGRIQDFKQAAVWLNMSPARVSQLMSLNFLSTSIKDAILNLPVEKLAKISNTAIRDISAEIDWEKQTVLWQSIVLN